MAEVFGIVSGALGVAALFNNCLDCFDYIQLGRHFGGDYQRCQLKLDVARTRLGRWGEAVDIHQDPRFSTNTPGEKSVLLAQSILEEIHDLFQSAYKTSRRYEKTAEPQDLVRYDEEDLTPVWGKLHGRLKDLAHRRQKDTSLVKKTIWALYDGREYEETISQITKFIDSLEKLWPSEAACRQLAELEIAEIDDEPSLAALQDAAQGSDRALLDATTLKTQMIAGRNFAKEVKATSSADVQVGNQYGEAVLFRGMAITDSNEAGTVDARDTAKVQIGSRYGM